MNAAIDLGRTPSDILYLEEAPRAFRLSPGVAGAKIELRLSVSRTRSGDDTLYQVGSTLYFGKTSSNRILVGTLPLISGRPFAERPQEIVLEGFISDEQLRAADQLRAGGDLWITLGLQVSTVALAAGGMRIFTGDLSFPISPGEWGTQVDHVEAGGYVELLVPTPQDAKYAQMVQLIREARRLFRQGEVDASLNAARKALEPILTELRDSGITNAATGTKARDRDLAQRFAVMVENIHSTLCGAMHNDEITKDFYYSRPDASMLITATAGLINRYASTVR